jgi:DUF1680 family protein
MGLAKLYRATGDDRYIKLARIFLDARGPGGPAYNQRNLLAVDQTEAVGHAVRANYLYSGMADVAALTGDTRYEAAIKKIWTNVADTKLYLTGGVGALSKGESYGANYELPNNAYNETCAAVALMMWNQRMFLLTGESKYMDVFERTAYNGFMSGVSLSGDRFFYPNPLAYDGHSKNNSGYAGRAPWFGCACCPPNLMRTLASITGYFYAVKGDALYVNLYGQSTGSVDVAKARVTLEQTTDYPWKGSVRLAVAIDKPTRFSLRLRIPGWVQGRPVPSELYRYAEPAAPWKLRVAGEEISAQIQDGYAVIDREWHAGDTVELDLPMPVHRVIGNPLVQATRGRVAFERGPVVYCVEDVDRDLSLDQVVLPSEASVAPMARPDLLGGVTVLTISGAKTSSAQSWTALRTFTAIPYFAWNNRGLAPMAVWLRNDASPNVAFIHP